MTVHALIMPVPQVGLPRSVDQVAAQRRQARIALARLAARVGAPPDAWNQTPDGIPLPNGRFHWSITHKPLWCGAALSQAQCGIDIEHVAPRSRDLHDAVAEAEEWERIGGREISAFFRMWTAKEATLKANGRGIAGLPRCTLTDVLDDRRCIVEFESRPWLVEHFICDEHTAAVARRAGDVHWHVDTNPQRDPPPAPPIGPF